MSTQFAENALLYNEFLDYLSTADDVRIVGPISTGLRVWLLIKGLWRAFRITDQINATEIINAAGSIVNVSNSQPTSAALGLGVRIISVPAAGIAVVINASNAAASGFLTTGPTAQQLSLATGVTSNMVIKNVDAVNSVEIGPSTLTVGNGYVLETVGSSDDSVWLRNVVPASVWAIAVAGTPTIRWATFS